jgi:hypothetical protein
MPTVRRNVVLPDMFDPVMIAPRRASIAMVLGTASGSSGCLIAFMIDAEPESVNCGRVQPVTPAR